MAVGYEQDIRGCLAETIGGHGLAAEELAPLLDDAAAALEDLRGGDADGAADVLALPARRDDLPLIASVAADMRSRFGTVVVLGTGGSSLGGRAVAGLSPRGAPELRFADNLDPAALAALVGTADFRRTGFLAISKSGSTAETVAQYLVCHEAARAALGGRASGHFVVVTDPADSVLRRLAAARGHRVLDHDPGVGGRFSVLSAVGMLPAAIAGLDPADIRAGAASVLNGAAGAGPSGAHPAALGAAVSLGLARRRGAAMSVVMPYGDALAPLAGWHRQLWAESLGKGGAGTTPVPALGPVDQHSQLQLYLDGPRDKMFTIVRPDVRGAGPAIPAGEAGEAAMAALAGRTVGDLVAAQQAATTEALIARGRPARVFRLARTDAATLGALFMHFMLETMVAARMLGVNAFDQPAVEEGKTRTAALLGACGGGPRGNGKGGAPA